jgi:hypothetical protein
MTTINTSPLIAHLKLIMREQGVSQLVVVDDGLPGLMLHTNRKDFTPSRKTAVRTFPGPWFDLPE